MAAVPRIADVQCSRLKFEPGDRLLVKVRHSLTLEERKKLHRAVQAWCGDGVEVLVIDERFVELRHIAAAEQQKQTTTVSDLIYPAR